MESSYVVPEKIWNRNFICVVLGNLCLSFADLSVNPLVASYTQHLGASTQLGGLLVGMFFGISLLMRPISGPVTTKIDKRKLMIFVFLIGGVANLGYALFHTIPMFAVFRFLSGVQYSLVGSLLMTLAGDNLPPAKIASGMGVYGIGSCVGMAIAPSIGLGLLNFGTKIRGEAFGFTIVFLFGSVMLFLAVIPGIILRPDHKSREEIASTGAWYKNILTVHALPTTVVMLFIMLSYSLINAFVVVFAKEQGIGDISAFYVVLAAALVLSRPLSGHLTDKYGVGKITLPAIIIFAASFLIMGSSKSLLLLLIGGAAAAIGYGGAQPTVQAMCIQSETTLKHSVASNTIYIGMDLGFFAGPSLGGVISSLSSYSTMFKIGAIPIALAAVSFVMILPIYKRRLAALKSSAQ